MVGGERGAKNTSPRIIMQFTHTHKPTAPTRTAICNRSALASITDIHSANRNRTGPYMGVLDSVRERLHMFRARTHARSLARTAPINQSICASSICSSLLLLCDGAVN